MKNLTISKYIGYIQKNTYSVNRYNCEQTIIVNFLRKNNKIIELEYSTHITDNIIYESDNFLVNNFYPISFSKYGIKPMKKYLLPSSKIDFYTDYYTEYEWKELYKKYVDNNFKLDKNDNERILIN
ncbi:hypothetical protein R4Q14_15495, partial [Brachyspira intermedia]|uniref:hypothetical protein n=1 Tax=Brachyspira intermedia TaxID=84377 RepID=UPI003004316D